MRPEEPKKCLYICMGSACHQLGVYEVLPRIQELITYYRLDVSVELKGSFCLGPCSDGIIMKFGSNLFTHIRPENVDDKFVLEILPQLKTA
ncbi:hypothetical protein CSB45_01290 [candidate division KSB3 bacterium]|uniref:NADH-quinone oxidoreductase subunit F n=1 Tax=candidate division KSB3 bacterium TaxID=2044937 RepID=A0A2G6EAF1_9BACT|nr:MAG: hypothetical protein CSB45_01290 [candidate division KSB3 bacterium]PIE30769.1 MAG: hypothetical protein CSA57_02060 [candidate division KSB3 bacterium]